MSLSGFSFHLHERGLVYSYTSLAKKTKDELTKSTSLYLLPGTYEPLNLFSIAGVTLSSVYLSEPLILQLPGLPHKGSGLYVFGPAVIPDYLASFYTCEK